MNERSHTSMLEGPIWKGLLAFAIPILLGNLFQQLYNTADSLIVGNFLGKESLAAVSSSSSLIFMLISFLQGIAMGAGVLIAKYFGAKEKDNLQLVIHTGLAFAVVGGVFLSIFGTVLAPQILRLMGTPDDVLPKSVAYFRTYFVGALAVFLYNFSTSILQNVGDSRHPLYYLIISSFINIALDLLFVGVFHMGVAAAAAATVISQAFSAILCLRQLVKAETIYQVDLKKIRFHGPTMMQIFKFGIPSGIQNSVIAFANVLVQSNINAFGANAMAGCGSYAKLEGFAFLPVSCFSMALSTFVGQNLGAKQYDRIHKGVRFGIGCCGTLSMVIGLGIFFGSPWLVALFNNDPEVVAFGVQQAHIEALFYFLLGASHCLSGIFRGAGKPTVPMVVMLMCWCVIRVIYITVMIRIIPDIRVIFWAYPITWTLSTIVFITYYFKGGWLHNFDRMDAAVE